MEEEDLELDIVSDEGDDLYEHYRIIADKGQGSLRIDKFVFDRLEKVSRNRIQNAARAGSILVNGQAVKPNYKIRPFDEVSIVFSKPPLEYTVEPEKIDLDILYEDDEVLVLNKQAGLVVHPGHGNFTGTLVHGLLYHLNNLPQINGASRPGIVHRLDKNTSGVMVIGKTDYALSHLAKQFYNRTTDRLYVGLVWGDFEQDKGTIEGNIGRDHRNRKLMSVFPDGNEGKHAVTHYEVLKRFGYTTLVNCKLETGRTHQIRVHMRYIGHTLFNDYSYGGDRVMAGTIFTKYKQFIANCFQIVPYHTLHAQSLAFDHPISGERLKFETPIPQNFKELVEKWENYSKNFNL